MANKQNSSSLAVMIDVDNAQAALVQELMSEISRYGTVTIKRACGDWTTTNLTPWKTVLHANAVQPIQQFRCTTGKNATDSALTIDAMDVLHSGHVDGFCLVSSDSDFTRLATSIREAGLEVYGFGERHTPEPFVAARDKFIYLEIRRQKPTDHQAPAAELVEGPATELVQLQPLMITATDARTPVRMVGRPWPAYVGTLARFTRHSTHGTTGSRS